MVQTSRWQQIINEYLPTGAGCLFFIQIFATLSYAVLFSSIEIYMTQVLHISTLVATTITGSFIGFNYALHLFGGFLGGRYLSYRLLFIFGMIAQVIACLIFSLGTTESLYWAIGAFLAGTGVNVTVINLMVTQLFEPEDKRRESVFLWNYSGMNIGFFLGFSLAGYFQLRHNYHSLFLWMSLGNAITILLALFHWKTLRDKHTVLVNMEARRRWTRGAVGVLVFLALAPALTWLVQHASFANRLIMYGALTMLVFLIVQMLTQKDHEARNKMIAYLILGLASLLFWSLYMLAPSGLTLFALYNVDRHVAGFLISPQWIQNINTVVIVVGGPLMSVFLKKMRARGLPMSIPRQFTIALFCMTIGFALLPIGIHWASTAGLSNFWWLFWSYVFQSVGELFLSPIGYAMVGQLAPHRLQGIMMGTWMMVTGVAGVFASYLTNLVLTGAASNSPLATNANYAHLFGHLSIATLSAGIILLFLVPFLKRLINEK